MASPAQFFRAGVGAVIINADGLVLVCERADVPGAWQLPQGGLKANESADAALVREVLEETGLSAEQLERVDAYPQPLAYELPLEMRSAKTGRGQVNYWFLLRLAAPESAVTLEAGGEFITWRWMTFEELLAGVVPFRRPVYAQVRDRFAPFLA